MKHLLPAFMAAVLSAFVLLSCATSSGSLFSSMMEGDEKKTAPEEQKAKEKPETGVVIETDPAEAEVYINKEFQGETPLTLKDLKPGSYTVEIRSGGYRTDSRIIEIRKDVLLEIDVALQLITGFISVSTVPAEALVTLGAAGITEAVQEVPAGTYTLDVRSFGYAPYTETVTVEENMTISRTVTLAPAEFAVSDFNVFRSRFNPANPGSLGKARLSFTVTAPGKGSVIVYNSQENPVAGFDLPPFTDWDQMIEWDGKNAEGKYLPDGTYSLALNASGDGGSEALRETAVIIDTSQAVSYRSLFHGSSGLLYAPTTDMLPPDIMQISFLVLGHLEQVEGVLEARFPAVLGLRFSAFNLLDCTVSLSVVPQTADSVPYSAGGSARLRFLKTPGAVSWNMAAALRGTFQRGETLDSFTNYGAVYAGFPMQFEAGVFGLSLTPEIAFSTKRVSYIKDEVFPELDFYVWSYLRAGIFLDFGFLGSGLSYALRTKPFSEGFALQFPMAAALEFWFFIPKTQVVMEAAVAGEFGDTGFYLMGGLGFGFFN